MNDTSSRTPRWDKRTLTALAAVAGSAALAVTAATHPLSARAGLSALADANTQATIPACISGYQPRTGYSLDVCLTGDGTTVTPSLNVHQLGDTGTSCQINLEIWDDANDKLAAQSLPCVAGPATGTPLDLGQLSGATANTHPDGSLTVHAFARLTIDGQDISIPDQGDSPTVTSPGLWWCPTGDSTRPVCSAVGAFQNDVPDDYNTAVSNIGNPGQPLVPAPGSDDAILTEADAVSAGMLALGWTNAHEFFQHYLDGSGDGLTFDSTTAYHASKDFASTVDATVAQRIATAQQAAQNSIDSGWLDYTFTDNIDWKNAVGHGFYRVTGQREADGTWAVRLQLTSYYQFRPDGPDFKKSEFNGLIQADVKQADMRRLEQIGRARNYREIGGGTLTYDAQGHPGAEH